MWELPRSCIDALQGRVDLGDQRFEQVGLAVQPVVHALHLCKPTDIEIPAAKGHAHHRPIATAACARSAPRVQKCAEGIAGLHAVEQRRVASAGQF